MAIWDEVLCSKIIAEHRSDADFYKPEYNLLEKFLNTIKLKNYLGELAFSIKKGIFDISPIRYRNIGVPLIRTYQIKKPIASEEKLVFISKKSHSKEFSKTELLQGDIVFTKIGAGIGDVSILPRKYPYYNFSQNVAGLSINRQKIDPYYLLCYLISRTGREQILRYIMPSGQGKLELRDIKRIIIPRLNSHEVGIASLLKKSEELSKSSQLMYLQSQEFLENELGLHKLEFEKPVGYEVSFSTISESRIIDSKYHDPKYKILEDNLKHNFKTYKLKEIAKVEYGYMPTQDYETDPQKGIPLIRVTNIKDDLEVVNSDLKYIPKSVKVPNKKFVEQNDILMVQCGDTTGKVGYIFDDIKGYLFPSFCLSVKVLDDKFNPLFLAALLKTRYMQILFDQTVMINTVRPNTTKPRFENLEIPLFDEEFQSRIANLLIKSKQLKYESKQLLEKAKQMVEDLIEEAAG